MPEVQWSSWRGPHQNGYSDDTRAPLQWSETENLKWKTELPGFGNSSPIVWDKYVFLTSATRNGSERWVLCVDRQTGSILWQKTAAIDASPEKFHNWNTPASASCVTDGTHVYAFFGTPGVFCCDFTGKLIWERRLGAFQSSTSWGAGAASPVLFEDLLIVNGDHGGEGVQEPYEPSYLWALNKRTGEVVWKTPRNQGQGWGTPVFINTKGRVEMVVNSPHGVWSYDPRTGKEHWHVNRKVLFGEPMPVWDRDTIYVLAGRPGPAYAIRMGGTGDIAQTHLAWNVEQKGRRFVSSPILVGDHLYLVDKDGVALCVEAKTGKEIWKQRLGGSFCASPVCVQGKLLFLNDQGTLFVIEPGTQYRPVHTNKLGDGDQFRASPAIVDGQILIRSDRRLYCVQQ